MASYLRPRRGMKATATSNAIVLKRGEVFFETPTGGCGSGHGSIKMGDGTKTYSLLPYFITDLDNDDARVAFTNTASNAGSTTIGDNSTPLGNIKPDNSLKTILTNIKSLLCNYHAQIYKLNNDLDGKQPAGSYAAANHNHSGVYQPAGSYAASSHNHSWSNITSGKPTTLSGYGITDAVKNGSSWFTNGKSIIEVADGSYQCSPNNKPSQGIPSGLSEYGQLLIMGHNGYTSILYIDVFGCIAIWSSNGNKWIRMTVDIAAERCLGLSFIPTREFSNRISFNYNGSGTVTIYVDNTAMWSGQSDRRLKENIKEVSEDYINAIGEIDLIQFNYNDINKFNNNKLYIGAIAQDIISSMKKHNIDWKDSNLIFEKELTYGEKDYYYGIDYTQLLLTRLAYDEKRITELENKLK